LVIAENTYRLRTSNFRTVRFYLPFLIGIPVLAAILFVVPWLTNQFLDEVQTFFLSVVAVVFIQIILLAMFILFVTFPISFALNTPQTEQYEILLAAPVKTKDVLLGKFIGDMPLYSVAVVAVSSFLVALMLPLGISLLQAVVIVLIFVLTYYSALWIGTVCASVIRVRLGRSSRSRDIGKALAMTIALPLVAVMYALMGGGIYNALLASDGKGLIPFILTFIPSSWGADIVIDFAANPGDIGASFADLVVRLSAMIAFFIAVMWLGCRVSDRAYNLEAQGVSYDVAAEDGAFYRAVRMLTGRGAFSSLVVTLFKDYGRRLENVSKVVYVLGLVLLVTIFFDPSGDSEGGVASGMIFMMFLLPYLSGFIVGEVTIRGKENLFIYRKAPNGESSLVKARLVQGTIIMMPLTVVATAIMFWGARDVTAADIVIVLGFAVILSIALVLLSLGLFLTFPVFSEKPSDMMVNLVVTMFYMMGCLFLTIFLGLFGEPEGWVLLLSLASLAGAVAMYRGVRNLKTME